MLFDVSEHFLLFSLHLTMEATFVFYLRNNLQFLEMLSLKKCLT